MFSQINCCRVCRAAAARHYGAGRPTKRLNSRAFFSVSMFRFVVCFVILSLMWLAVHIQMKRKVVDRAGNEVKQDAWEEGEERGVVKIGLEGEGGEGE